MPDPDGLDEEEEEEEVEEGNLPSLDPTLDNQYYGFLNVPRSSLHELIANWEAMMADFGPTINKIFIHPNNIGRLNRQRSQQPTKGWQGCITQTSIR